jgi:hypothetical protein
MSSPRPPEKQSPEEDRRVASRGRRAGEVEGERASRGKLRNSAFGWDTFLSPAPPRPLPTSRRAPRPLGRVAFPSVFPFMCGEPHANPK